MSTVVRYTTYTSAEAFAGTVKAGSEVALLAQTVVLPTIAAGANGNVFTLPTPGKILEILSAEIRTVGAIRVATHTITVNATGKIVNIAVPAGGVNINAGDILVLLLAVGV